MICYNMMLYLFGKRNETGGRDKKQAPVLFMKSASPPGWNEETTSHTTRPDKVPPMTPDIIALPPRLAQKRHKVKGITADPIKMPMNEYNHPRLIW